MWASCLLLPPKILTLDLDRFKGGRPLEADTSGHPTAIYDLIARLDPAGRFHLYRVTQVELAASVITDISQPPQRVTMRLTHPNAGE